MPNTRKKIRYLSTAAAIAALYTVLTLLSAVLGLSGGVIQLRLSEALTVLAVLTPAAIPGLTLGCLISNILCGCLPWDVVLGTVATLLGALGTYFFRKHMLPSLLCPVWSNAAIIPPVLLFVYGAKQAYSFLLLSVFLGEALAVCVLGGLVLHFCKKRRLFTDL